MSNFNLSNSDALLLNGEGTQNCAENQLLDNRTATADNTKSPKIMTFPEFPNSTDDGNVKLPDCPIREDNNIASFVNKNSENSMGELLSSINEFDCNFEKNGNTEAHPCNWPSGIFADDGLVNDSNVLHAADGIDRSRWSAFSPVFDFNAEAYLNLVPEMVQNQYAPQYDAHADDGDRDCNHQKQLLTEEVSNIDVPLVTDHLTQNVCTTSNDFTSPSCLIQDFQQNENGLHIENLPNPQIQSDTFEAAAVFFVDNVMQTFPENTFEIHPIEDTSAPSNVVQSITGDVDGSRWSAFSPAFDFNAETYFSSEPEMVLIMNDQHAPQYGAYANDGDRDCNNQKQLLTEEVSNIDVPLVTDHLTQNVKTSVLDFQQNENGLHIENLPNPQIQSDTFEAAAVFFVDNVMQTFPENTFEIHPIEDTSAPSNVVQSITGDVDGSRWSAFSPAFDFNAETYFSSEPEMVLIMNDQHAPQYGAYANDGDRDCNNQKQLLTEEVSNIDVPLVTDHLTQNVKTSVLDFQQNENGLHIENLPNPQIQSDTFEAAAVFFVDNVMQTFPENTFEIHPIEDTSAPSNVVQSITGDVDGSRWSAFSPAFDFNAETYFSSEPEMVLIMNDQHAPQYDAYADDEDRDCNNQKRLLTEEVGNIHVPLATDNLTQNVCTTSNDFTSPSCFIQNFQQNENGLHTENLPNPQIQSDTFESAAGFLIDNVMQTFPESPLGMHPLDYSFALSSVAENNTEGTLQNEAHGDERNTDYNNQKQPTNELISNVDVLHPAKDVAQNVGTTSIGFTPSFCFTEDVQQNANEPQNIENQIKSAPDSEMQINTFEGVGDCSTDSATHNTQMHELHEKNVKNTTYACFQCQKPFENISDLCKHINQCLQNYKDLASDTNQSALAESCSQAKHQPGEALEKSQWKMCDVCKKLFSCYSALHIHYRSHTKETPYQCDICGRRFTTKFSKNRHLESQHFVKRPRCYKSPSHILCSRCYFAITYVFGIVSLALIDQQCWRLIRSIFLTTHLLHCTTAD
ncbi:Homeotic protein spalt-major [Trichinella pseudospiralis]